MTLNLGSIINLELFYCFLDIGILHFFCSRLLTKKKSNILIKIFIYIVSSILIYIITTESTYSNYSHLFSIFIILIYSILVFEGTLIKKILVSFSFYIILGLVSLLVTVVITKLMGVEVPKLIKSGNIRFVITLLIKTVTILIGYYVSVLIKNEKMTDDEQKLLLFFLLIVLFLLILLFDFSFLDSLISKVNFVIIISLTFVFYTGLILLLFYRIMKSVRDKNRLQVRLQEEEYKNLSYLLVSNQLVEMSKFKHEINNHIITLKGLINDEETRAIEYLDKLSISPVLKSYVQTENNVINAILNHKISEFPSIQFRVRCSEGKFEIPYDKMTIILGNALDNAIEAIQRGNGIKREINVVLVETNMFITIGISNPTAQNLVTKKGILYSSKDPNRVGFGIKNMEQALKSIKGELRFSVNNDIFKLSIVIEKPQTMSEL